MPIFRSANYNIIGLRCKRGRGNWNSLSTRENLLARRVTSLMTSFGANIHKKKLLLRCVELTAHLVLIKKHVIMSSVVTLPIIFTRVGQGREMRMPLMSHWWPSCITSAKVWPCERQNNMWALNLTITKLVMIMQCKCWVKNKIIRYIWMLHVLF